MRSSLTLIALALLSVIAFTDTASAGLFGRVRARRTAEMQSAVAGQVGLAAAELGASLDAQVAAESEKLDTHLAAGSKKLEGQLTAGLAQLQQQAQAMLAAETKKLEQQLAEQIAKMHTDAQQTVVAESTKLRAEVEAKVAKLNASANAQIKDAIAKFDGDMSKGVKEAQDAALAARTASVDMQTAVRNELDKLKIELSDMLENQLASATVPAPADEPAEPEAPEEKAVPSTATRLEEEKKG
ncbi:MAG: hypothetical protein H8E66_04680 [Planctomycetes bacterium]|nr:hypothetical protein [Planctomycetota bacterium]